MERNVIRRDRRLCLCCMEEHDVETVCVRENITFKREKIEYNAFYFFCNKTEEYYSDEDQIQINDISMKDAYRQKMGLLTSDQIIGIRKKYDISQNDLCVLLGWGAKTITRYEGHQVQTAAHDCVLRKINDDPEWFIQLLMQNKTKFSDVSYGKYYEKASVFFAENKNNYLKKSIEAEYAPYEQKRDFCGGVKLDLNKVVDIIRYFANSPNVTNLYKVKTMKMLWYADALSYKRYNHSITGLVYMALQMGAVPLSHAVLIDLDGIEKEEYDFGDGVAYHFVPSHDKTYLHLSEEDKSVLNKVITLFGKDSKDQIVEKMHKEEAYSKTPYGEIISFEYSKNLTVG